MFICEIWLFDLYFLSSANLLCQSTDLKGPFDFEITRADCI